jgi:rubrerythrin
MSDQSQVCFTLEAALERAIEMENGIFSDFLSAVQSVKSGAAKAILRDAALGKLNQKQQIEKALLEGTIDEVELHAVVPTMHLDTRYGKKMLNADADAREALAYSIHVVTDAVTFYHDMAKACAGAPMSRVFDRLSGDQTTLLQELEDSYEEHFLTEN